jgi:hypothetical protein
VFPYFIVLFIDNHKKKLAYSLFSLQFVSYYYLYTNIMNKNLNNDSHQFHQYQQNEQSSLAHRNSLNTMKDHCGWKVLIIYTAYTIDYCMMPKLPYIGVKCKFQNNQLYIYMKISNSCNFQLWCNFAFFTRKALMSPAFHLNVFVFVFTVDGDWTDWTPWATCPVTCGVKKAKLHHNWKLHEFDIALNTDIW